MPLSAPVPGPDPSSNADFTVGVLVAVLLSIAYFLPTLIALGRGRGAGLTALVLNVFLGWTVIGWFVALAVAFGDHRRKQLVVIWPRATARHVIVSPDGAHWWTGRRWLDATAYAPWGALRSPDGAYWWDGGAWQGGPRLAHTVVEVPGRERTTS
jgi:hypothetical protein